MNYSEAVAKQERAQERRKKRRAKARQLWGHASRGAVRAQTWKNCSLFVRLRDKRKKNGRCMVGVACRGWGFIELAYHIVPQQRGDATRYDLNNIVGACRSCNRGEQMNRSLYREHHIRIFGRERVEALEAKARETVHLSTADLAELGARFKAMIENREYAEVIKP